MPASLPDFANTHIFLNTNKTSKDKNYTKSEPSEAQSETDAHINHQEEVRPHTQEK